ncbi:MAG: TetR/AcrR family transcriptional regulator [Nannocystales bacterium]
MAPRVRKPHQPQQARSRFLADAVLEAAERVVREVGWSKAKVARIAKVAGVSVGSLYRYFPGRDVLLRAIIDRALESDHAAFLSSLESARGETLEASLEAFIDALLADKRLTHPALLSQLVDLLDSAGRLETVRTRFDDMIRHFAQHIARQHPELGAPDLVERRSHIAFWGTRAAFVARVRVEDPFDLAAFRSDALHLTAAMLRKDAAGAT